MADLRIPPANIAPPARPTGPRAEAVSAAQRAFFNAALNGAQAAQTPVAPASAPKAAEPATPQRLSRPGSLLDIKV